jgi:hypothetical protein
MMKTCPMREDIDSAIEAASSRLAPLSIASAASHTQQLTPNLSAPVSINRTGTGAEWAASRAA